MKPLRPDWRDPLTYGVILALIILIVCGLTSCGKDRSASPKGGRSTKIVITEVPPPPQPKTVKESKLNEDDLRSEIGILQDRLSRAEADTARLQREERRARMETLARVIQWAAALAMLAGVALTVLGFIRPELRFLRTLSAVGGGAAALVFGLASYLPMAADWLGPIALTLTVGGALWLVYRLHRTGQAARGAIEVAEVLKRHVNPELSPDLRKMLQLNAAGKRAPAIDEMINALELTPRA